MISEYYSKTWIAEQRSFVDQVSRRPEIIAEYEQSMKDFEEGRYYTASSPEEMIDQIKQRN